MARLLGLFEKSLAQTQAKLCETQGHWAWAAILWRRTGEDHNAIECENILQATAKNMRLQLVEEKPIVMISNGLKLGK